jgi:AcrR family transcriptional regulator
MPPTANKQNRKTLRSARSDGAETRDQILKVAGKLFAEKGFSRTTSKEICATAGTDLAAVNYHFGNRDGLYDAVLVEAHAQIINLDELEELAKTRDNPEQILRALIALLIRNSSGTELPWGFRVLFNELMVAPSKHLAVLLRKAVFPKVCIIKSIVADVLGLPIDHPAVQRAIALVIMPCIMMAIVPGEALSEVLPKLKSDRQALFDDMATYALAGLRAMKSEYRA